MTTSQVEPAALPWHDHLHSDRLQFSMALEELRNIRPHLYSAAQYYESAYLHNDQKQAVIESLKDYSAKALVNAVDHVGTVAFQLNKSLSQHTAEISTIEVRKACLTQRLRTCHERTNRESLSQCQKIRSMPSYHKHYDPAETTTEKHSLCLLQSSPKKLAETLQDSVGSDSDTLKSLSWYLAIESSPTTMKSVPNQNRSTSSKYKSGNGPTQGCFSRSLSSGQISMYDRASDASVKARVQASSSSASKSLVSLMLSDEAEYEEEATQKKGLLSSFLSKSRSGKPKSFDSCKH